MKKYISFIAILLCSLVVNAKPSHNQIKTVNPTECSCCKKCKDKKCIALCKQWNDMSPEARKGEEGQKVKDECMKICKENKCCSADGSASCEGMMEGKDCCKKKK